MSKFYFAAKNNTSTRLRARKYALVRKYGLPEDLLDGHLQGAHRRCGKPNCHCVDDAGHAQLVLYGSHQGKRYREHIPKAWELGLQRLLAKSEQFLDAVYELIDINRALLKETRQHITQKNKRHT